MVLKIQNSKRPFLGLREARHVIVLSNASRCLLLTSLVEADPQTNRWSFSLAEGSHGLSGKLQVDGRPSWSCRRHLKTDRGSPMAELRTYQAIRGPVVSNRVL